MPISIPLEWIQTIKKRTGGHSTARFHFTVRADKKEKKNKKEGWGEQCANANSPYAGLLRRRSRWWQQKIKK